MVTFCLLLFVTNIDLADGDIAYGDELGAGFIINLEIGYLCRIVGILKIENDFETDICQFFGVLGTRDERTQNTCSRTVVFCSVL